MGKKLSIAEQIRRAIDASGMTRRAVCRRAGMDEGYMSRFMSGRSSMSLDTLDRLALVVGFEIRRTERRTKHGKTAK